VCDATKRLIVHSSIVDEVTEQLKNFIASKQVGDPLVQDTDIGSLAAQRQQVLLQKQVEDARVK